MFQDGEMWGRMRAWEGPPAPTDEPSWTAAAAGLRQATNSPSINPLAAALRRPKDPAIVLGDYCRFCSIT